MKYSTPKDMKDSKKENKKLVYNKYALKHKPNVIKYHKKPITPIYTPIKKQTTP